MKEEVYVPESKFREIDKKYSCQSIIENGTVQTFFWQNEEWVHTGGCRHPGGLEVKDATRVVELSVYKGELKPLEYGDHWHDVDNGNRKREYTGMLVKQGKRNLVFTGSKVSFLKIEVGKQLTLF